MRARVVRPYGDSIRKQVFDLLERCGVRIDASAIVVRGTPDAAAAASIIEDLPPALLTPFNAHRDDAGTLIHGLSFLHELGRQNPEALERPLLMPITPTSMSTYRLLQVGTAEATYAHIVDRLFLMPVDDLEALEAPLIDYLSKAAVPFSTGSGVSGIFSIEDDR